MKNQQNVIFRGMRAGLLGGILSLAACLGGCATAESGYSPDIAAMSCAPGVLPCAGESQELSLDKPVVFAHHVPWHNAYCNYMRAKDHREWAPQRDKDLLTSMKREIALAQAAGIDGFLINIGDMYCVREAEPYYQAAAGTNFKIGICLDRMRSADQLVKDITEIVERLGKYPNYPRINGRYVFSSFAPNRIEPEAWAEAIERLKANGIEIFHIYDAEGQLGNLSKIHKEKSYLDIADMFYVFTASNMAWNCDGESPDTHKYTFDTLTKYAASQGKSPIVLVQHGYVGGWDAKYASPGYIPPRGFDKLWDCFNSFTPGSAKWVHITTWNDCPETSIYPRIFDHGADLELIRAFTDAKVRQLPPRKQSEPKLYFAALRESAPGTTWRLEALNAPVAGLGKVTISGRLLDNAGNEVQTLASKELATADFDRCEWLIPTGPLAKNNALVPEITAQWQGADGKLMSVTHKLPAVLLRGPWIDVSSTVRSPLHAMADVNSTLSVSQDGNILKAKVSFDSDECVTRAILFRNDRPVAEFRPERQNKVSFNCIISPNLKFKTPLEIKPINCKFAGVCRRFGFEETMVQEWDADHLLLADKTGRDFMVNLIGDEDAAIEIYGDGKLLDRIELSTVVTKKCVQLAGEIGRIAFCDTNMYAPLEPAPLGPGVELECEVWSRLARERDCFQVCFLTKQGHAAWSPLVFPNATEELVTMKLLENAPGWDCRPNNNGCLDPARPALKLTQYPVSNFCLREALWNFNDLAEPTANAIGELPFCYETLEGMIRPEGPDGSSCLVFNGNQEINCHWNGQPIAACTIEFKLYLNTLPASDAWFIRLGSNQKFDNFQFWLTPQGVLNVKRGFGYGQVAANIAITAGKWYTVKFVFDEESGKLFIDGQQVGSAAFPLYRRPAMNRWVIGHGFNGKLDDVRFSGVPR